MSAVAAESLGFHRGIFGIGKNIQNMNGSVFKLDAADQTAPPGRERYLTHVVVVFRGMTIARGGVESVSLPGRPQHLGLVGAA